MGQEAGKPAWPKPSGGYQTITGRRHARRHTCVSFRPSLNSQDRDEHQHEDPKLEGENGQNDNTLIFCDGSSPLVWVSSDLLDEPLLENTGTGEPICQTASSRTFEASMTPFSLSSYDLEGNRISGNSVNPHENSEDLAEYASGGHSDLNGQNGFAFVNIDSYETDSCDREGDDAQDKLSLAREAEAVFQATPDNMFSELENDIEHYAGLQSQFSTLTHSVSRECCEAAGPMPLMGYFSIGSDWACPDNRTFKLPAEDEAIPNSNLSGASCEAQQIRNEVDVGIGTAMAIANELNVSDGRIDQGNSPELVVRPKIRKQNTANQFERGRHFPNDREESVSWRNEVPEVQQGHAERPLRNNEEGMSSSMFFDLRGYEGHQKNTEIVLGRNAGAEEQKEVTDDGAMWDYFEDCNGHSPMSHNDEDRSEWSDGEWSTAVPTCFTVTEKDQSSSDESWETVPVRDECDPELQSSSSGIEEENTGVCFHGRERTLFEEGEVPWLRYREEVESSSGEENDPVSDFVHPGFFLLEGNNNLEDDSSVSEDLDVEWRILDEFGDGLGLARAIPYMDPQFLAFVALEGRLQAMEAAVIHLESVGFDDEQACPPASEEAIDHLPQIVVTDDHEGQEQCCTICCSEYVKGEIITELPCHHFFHKPCVTIWLQKSGTCPVCRHVLAPVPPEAAAAAVSFLSDDDSSLDSATGTSN